MDKNLAGLIGVMGALVAAPAAQAASSAPANFDAVMQVNSYSDLLKPIPNALALKASAAAEGKLPTASDKDRLLRRVDDHHHHHHHDHHHHHHHDHHHHYN